MKFLHISDTHLGYNQYGLIERGKDFLDVFNEAIDIAIDNNVDFIIHTGDFFHTSRPSNNTFLEAINLLNRLKDKNIPIFVISGNHDRGNQVRDISPLKILENLGLTLLDGKSIEFNGITISGVKYISKLALRTYPLKELLEKMLEKAPKTDFHILMLHQEFNPYFPDSDLYIHSDIPEGFNYVGIGHYHIPQEPISINDNMKVVFAGSTEYTSYNKQEEEFPKGVHLVEVMEKIINYQFIPLKTRPFIYQTITDENFESELKAIKTDLENKELHKKPILVLKGNLKTVSQRDIRKLISELDIEKYTLHIRYNLSFNLSDISTEFQKMQLKEEFINKKLKELIGSNEMYEEVISLISQLKTFESTDEMKKFLQEL